MVSALWYPVNNKMTKAGTVGARMAHRLRVRKVTWSRVQWPVTRPMTRALSRLAREEAEIFLIPEDPTRPHVTYNGDFYAMSDIST